jgi:hypothetical protein
MWRVARWQGLAVATAAMLSGCGKMSDSKLSERDLSFVTQAARSAERQCNLPANSIRVVHEPNSQDDRTHILVPCRSSDAETNCAFRKFDALAGKYLTVRPIGCHGGPE